MFEALEETDYIIPDEPTVLMISSASVYMFESAIASIR